MKKYQGVNTLEVLQFAKNYNSWIADTFLSHLNSPVLEIGAGIGNLSHYFKHITPYTMSDVDSHLVQELKRKFGKQKDHAFITLDVTRKVPESQKNQYGSILGINVLEHIEHDELALQNIHAVLKRKGKLLLLVPAKKVAFTRFDHILGHFRRYEKEELKKKVEAANFVIDELYFFNMLGLISWIVRDKVERKNIHMKSYQVKLFDWIVPILRRIEGIQKPPAGVSLILVAHKK